MSTVQTISDLGDTLKNVYAPLMTNLSRLESTGATLIPQTDDGLNQLDDGMEVRPRIQLTPSSLSASRAEGESYPVGNTADYVQAVVRLAKHATRYAFTPEQERRSLADLGSWEDIGSRYAREVGEDAGRDFAAQLYGLGNGIRAITGATSGSNVIQLDADTTMAQMRTLRRGMKVDVGSVANPIAVAASRNITAVDFDNKTITVSGSAVSTSADDAVFVSGAGGSTSWGAREIVSLQQIAGSEDLYGVAVADNPEFVGFTSDGGGVERTLTATLAQRVRDDMRQNGGTEPTHGITSPGVFRSAVAAEAAKVRYTMDNQNDIDADIDGIKLGSMTLVQDDYVWEGHMFAVSFGEEGVQCPSSGNYKPVNPSVTFETDPNGSDDRIYRTYKFHQLVAAKRNSIGHVTDLAEA